jgi:hypothetical protein
MAIDGDIEMAISEPMVAAPELKVEYLNFQMRHGAFGETI